MYVKLKVLQIFERYIELRINGTLEAVMFAVMLSRRGLCERV